MKSRSKGENGPGEKQVVGRRHKRFHQLPADIRSELDEKITFGVNLPEVADWLHGMGHFEDMTHEVLTGTLYRYRADLKPVGVGEKEVPKSVKRLVDKLTEGIDEIQELKRLYRVQLERIEIGATFEHRTNVLNRHMAAEIDTAANLLMRSHKVKVDRGIVKPSGPRNGDLQEQQSGSVRLEPHVERRYDGEVVGAAKNPVSRGKVLALLSVLNNLSEDGMTFDVDTDESDD